MKTLPFRELLSAILLVMSIVTAIQVSVFGQQPPAEKDVVLLNQGWSHEDRMKYYYTSQGTAVLPYELFVNLEEANSSDLFRSDRISRSLGIIPQAADPTYNPDGLGIGITRAIVPEGRWKGEWVGITCAICHTTQLQYKGQQIRIDGGISGFDFTAFSLVLKDALNAAVTSPEKLDRLTIKMNLHDAPAKAELKRMLEVSAKDIANYRQRSDLTPFPLGPGRMDCLGLIHNRVASDLMQIPENWVASLAPTKSPFLWNSPQSAWVQWTGFASDPLSRNIGESLGVFIKVDLASKTPEEGLFDSTLDVKGQIEIENLLRRLAPPKWPEEVLGAIDRPKAATGAELFVQNCAECHSVWPHRWSEPALKGKRFIENALVPLDVIGTDPMQFQAPQFERTPSTITGALSDYLAPPYQGAALAPFAAVSIAINKNIELKVLAKLGLTPAELEDARGYRSPTEKTPSQPIYKAGPRDGVWAVAPYLHNGSVPNLYELLLPAGERSKTFFVGRDFDPVKVGVDTSGDSGKFLFKTGLVGNSNLGHSFEAGPRQKGVIGRLLTDAERWAIIEYLKSIPTEEAQVTPFGGPADPVKALDDKTFFHNRPINKPGYSAK